MRFKNIVPALVVIASINTATAGNDPPIPTDQRQLDFELFDAAKSGQTKDVLLLLKHGGSIKARDRFGNTPLLLAALSGTPMTVDILIKAGSMINYQNLGGSTALLRAVKAGNDESAKLLLQAGADINAVNKQSLSPLVMAAYTGNLEIFKILLENGAKPDTIDNSGKSAMVYAAANGFSQIVQILLNEDIDVNQIYGNELTILMWAAGYSDNTPTGDALNTIDILIDEGAALNMQDNRGQTALMIASEMDHVEIVKRLLSLGARTDLINKQGWTALDLARKANSTGAFQTLNENR